MIRLKVGVKEWAKMWHISGYSRKEEGVVWGKEIDQEEW